jgi:outer membrane protein TolC
LVQAQARAEVIRTQRADPPELYVRARQERAQGGANANTLGIGMRIPLGTSARNVPLEAAALTEVEVAEATLRRLEIEKTAEREDAQAALQAAQAQLPRERERAALLRQRATWVEQAFNAGNTSLPELLRALDLAAQAELSAARQHNALGAAHARLQQAFGLLP